MSLVTLLTGTARRVGLRNKDNTADILLIDATISETTTLMAEVSEHPIEDGPDVTDHIRPKPVEVAIEGFISETPLTLIDDLSKLTTEPEAAAKSIARGFGGGLASQYAAQAGSHFGQIAGVGAGLAGAALFQSASNPAELARSVLEQMLMNRTIFTLQTKYKPYTNMVFTQVSFPRTNDIGRALKFSATARQIYIVTGETVQIQKIARSAAAGAKKANLGNQGTTPDENQKRSSLLFKGFQGAKSLFGGK